MRRAAPLLIATVVLPLCGCASLLGYDDLGERSDDASLAQTDGGSREAGTEASAEADVGDEAFDAGPEDDVPKARPTGAAVPSGKGKTLWFQVKHFAFGSEDHTGTKNANGWRGWGYDLDSVCTSATESQANVGTCRRVDGANADVLLDGDGCRDNNFGSQIVPLLLLSDSTFEDSTNTGILHGGVTWIFEIEDVDDGPDDPYAPGKLYRAATTGTGAGLALDGTDVRKVTSDSVIAGDLTRCTTTFADGYLRDHVWVSGAPRAIDVLVPIIDISFVAPVSNGIVTMVLSSDHRSASSGVAAGVVAIGEFQTLLGPVAERAGFCPGGTLYNSFLRQLAKFPDVVVAAPNLQDVSKTCDGVSLGVGFDLAPIVPVTEVVAPAPPPVSKCGDAGTD